VPPISQHPKPIAETFRSVRPNGRNSMAAPYDAASAESASRNAAPCLLRRDRVAVQYRDVGPAHNLLAAMSRISRVYDLKFRSYITLFARVSSFRAAVTQTIRVYRLNRRG
jgi:hypothetical protein